jgi:large subunit ribosomal protein L25
MSQQAEPLTAELRDRVGKGAARELRRNSRVPAVIYGDKKEPLTIALPYKELAKRIHAGHFLTTLVEIEVNGEKHRVLPKEYQVEPVRDFITHVDFLRISETSKVVVMLPVHFHNEDRAPGLRRGGVLNIVRHEVEVECPAIAIPEGLDVDLSGLDIGDSIHISAVKLPDKTVPTISDRDFTIATIAGSAAALPEEQAEAEVEAEDVEVIGDEGEEASEE